MLKNTDKKEGDDASTKSNASRYDSTCFHDFFPDILSLLFTLTGMVGHLCNDFSHSFYEMVWFHSIDLGIVKKPHPDFFSGISNSESHLFRPVYRVSVCNICIFYSVKSQGFSFSFILCYDLVTLHCTAMHHWCYLNRFCF